MELQRNKATDYPQELLDLFDLYVHGEIDRRLFLDRAQKFAVGGVTAMALWESLRPNYAFAQQVPCRRQAAQDRARHRAIAKWQRHDQRLLRSSRQDHGERFPRSW